MNRPYTLEDLKALSPDLLEELLSILQSMREIVTDPQSQNRAIWTSKDQCCPYCGCKNYVRNGHQKNGAQKFVCKECHRSFSMNTGTVGYNSHFNLEKWTKFIECDLNGLSIRKTAAIVGIHRNTALLWRHKLYSAIGYLQNSKLSGQIQVDAKNFSINFKGQSRETMPRNSKRRKSNKSSNKNNHSACVISALDEDDHMVFKVVSYGKETKEMYSVLSEQIEPNSTIIGDGFMGFEALAFKWKCKLEIVKADSHVNENGFSLADLNQLHSQIDTFFARYHGVSTRHLQGYLNMFVLRKQLDYRYEPQLHCRETWVSTVPMECRITRRNENKQAYPFDIWAAYRDLLLPAIPYQLIGVS